MTITVRRLSLIVLSLLLALILAQTTDTLLAGDDALAEGICDSVTEIPKTECEALVALYNSANGPGWTHTGWLATNTPCGWYGVTCSSGHVSALSLCWNQMSGSVPAELGTLPHLRNLDLSNN